MTAIIQAALPVPLARVFDYDHIAALPAGVRVRVPFGRRQLVGVVTGTTTTADERFQRKPITAVLDTEPLWPTPLWELLLWAADYYHHPLGEVIHHAMPVG